jgi:hypothetical protein
VVVGHEVVRDEVGLRVVLLSVVEGLVGLFVWAQDLHEISRISRVKQTTYTHHLREYRVGTSRPAKT